MNRFSEQLANLQRAASRSERDDDSGRSINRRDDSNSSCQQHHSHDKGRRGDRYYNDRSSSGRSYHQSPRKRGRDGDNNRFYNDRGRGGYGSGGGNRWRCEETQNSLAEQSTTLAELVNNVKSSYQASQCDSSTAMNDTTMLKGKRRRHIALLFLTIDDLPHEHVWREWLKSSQSTEIVAASEGNNSGSSSSNETPMVSVLCHAKFPDRIKSEWLRQRHLLQRPRNDSSNKRHHDYNDNNDSPAKFHSHRPEWGSIEITRAMIDLLEEGLRIGTDDESTHAAKYLSTPVDDTLTNATEECIKGIIPPVNRFIFLSESCLPVTTLEEAELALFGPRNASESSATLYDKSWVNARSTPNNGYSRQLQWDAIRSDNIPQSYIWKADQWMVLTRSHADAIASIPSKHLNGRQLWPAFRKCRASDEIYFPTALSVLGIVRRQGGEAQVDDFSKGESCAGNAIRRRRVTYCDWSLSAKNPAPFTSKDWNDVVVKARGEGCLFARKFVLLSSLREGSNKTLQPVNNDGIVSVDDWITVVAKKKFVVTQQK